MAPPPPEKIARIIEGQVPLWDLYFALVKGRPEKYPFTWAQDRWGIPTVSTPFSLENLRIIIDEALRIGPPLGFSEVDGPFMRYVRDTIVNGDPDNVIDEKNRVICYW
jgi:hypothetical protein